MSDKELLKLTPAQLVDMGVCPTCLNKRTNGGLYGANDDILFYEDESVECIFVRNPRAEGHACIISKEHYQDMSEAPDWLNEKIITIANRLSRIIKQVYGCERVYLCTMCDGPINHYHVQLIPRYSFEKRGSSNFVKPRKEYVFNEQKFQLVKRLLTESMVNV